MPLEEFRNFYQQHLRLEKDDFEAFMEAVSTRLPSAFRITPSIYKEKINEILKQYTFLRKVEFLEDVYTFDLKSNYPKSFMSFLVAQADIGNIQRQEVVSILPHLFLNVRPSDYVFETCAAPGSKTKNILESIKDGLLISNDRSSSRVNILVTESMKKATPAFIVTNMDASRYPSLTIKFDRIECDVPCSSDGTCRKNPVIMEGWDIKRSIGLSSMQVQILKRSLEFLKEGGRLVYSTCSMNPIEDEWVVHTVLENNEDFELLDEFDFVQFSQESSKKVTMRRGLTQFEYEGFTFNDEKMNKCFRVLPHDQNTGGFFVAVIVRKTPIPVKNSNQKKPDEILNIALVEADNAVKDRINSRYEIPNGGTRFVSFSTNFKKIFAISETCYKILTTNPKLKVSYAGMNAFVAFDLEKDAFRAKGSFLELAEVPCEYELSQEEFLKLLERHEVSLEELSIKPSKLFSCSVTDTKLKFCGFAGVEKAFLYIDDIHRKAYMQLMKDFVSDI